MINLRGWGDLVGDPLGIMRQASTSIPSGRMQARPFVWAICDIEEPEVMESDEADEQLPGQRLVPALQVYGRDGAVAAHECAVARNHDNTSVDNNADGLTDPADAV